MEEYLQEIDATPLLDSAEEYRLGILVARKDELARDLMTRANLRLVVKIAREFSGKGVATEDLVAEGNLGLVCAVEMFDPRRGLRFSTYATYWIKRLIKRSIADSPRTIRLPVYVVDLLAEWRRGTAILQDSLGRPPTQEEVARSLGLTKKKLAIVKDAMLAQATASNEDAPLDEVPTRETTNPADIVRLRKGINDLARTDAVAAQVLRLRFGLEDETPRAAVDIGRLLDLSRQQVQDIESAAIKKLGQMMR